MELTSHLIGNSNDENNFQHKLSLDCKQVSKIRKAFANSSSANIKLSKTQLSKIINLENLYLIFFTSIKGFTSLMDSLANRKQRMWMLKK